MIINTFYEDIYRLNYIIRYSNLPRINNESVACHSFMVAMIVLKLKDEYIFNLERAIFMALIHDLPEYATNDIPRTIKQKYNKLKIALEEIEDEILKNFNPIVRQLITEFESRKTIESIIVKLADSIQCLQYAENEIKLGNSGYMKKVARQSRKRIAIFKEQLLKLKVKK